MSSRFLALGTEPGGNSSNCIHCPSWASFSYTSRNKGTLLFIFVDVWAHNPAENLFLKKNNNTGYV